MTEKKVVTYVKNVRTLGAVFDLDKEVFAKVATRFPEVTKRLDLRIGYDDDEVAKWLPEAEILFAWEFDRSNLAVAAPKLQWIQLMGAGLDHLLPLDWLPPKVRLATAAGAHHDKAGEFLSTAVLMLNNWIPAFATEQRSAKWATRYSGPVTGKTVLLVGVGGTGGACAERCKALGMQVLGVRPSRRPHPAVDEMFGSDELKSVLPRADFVVVTVPLTERNRGTIGREEFACMKQGAGLVNIGRHGVVNEAAMMEALESGKLSGAVHDLEDPAAVPCDKGLWTTPNLLIIPHCLTNDPATFREHVLEVFFKNVDEYLAGRELETLVDRKLGY